MAAWAAGWSARVVPNTATMRCRQSVPAHPEVSRPATEGKLCAVVKPLLCTTAQDATQAFTVTLKLILRSPKKISCSHWHRTQPRSSA